MEPKTEYTIRVCGVRVPVPETELAGPYSPPAIFTTLSTDGSGVTGSGNAATTKRVTSCGTNIVQHVCVSFFFWYKIFREISRAQKKIQQKVIMYWLLDLELE